MSEPKSMQTQDGRIVVELSDCKPLVFDNAEDFSIWEHAFLTCVMSGNGMQSCFTLNPSVVDETTGNKPSLHHTN